MTHFRHEFKPAGEGYRNRECPTHHKTLQAARECIVRRHGEAYAEGRIYQEQCYNRDTGNFCYMDEWSLEPSDHDLNIKNPALPIWKVPGR